MLIDIKHINLFKLKLPGIYRSNIFDLLFRVKAENRQKQPSSEKY